jgi:hypothetical protein
MHVYAHITLREISPACLPRSECAQDNEWGGVESKRKRQLLEDQLIQMFRTRKELYRDQVEDFLTEFLEDEFSTYADDGR